MFTISDIATDSQVLLNNKNLPFIVSKISHKGLSIYYISKVHFRGNELLTSNGIQNQLGMIGKVKKVTEHAKKSSDHFHGLASLK